MSFSRESSQILNRVFFTGGFVTTEPSHPARPIDSDLLPEQSALGFFHLGSRRLVIEQIRLEAVAMSRIKDESGASPWLILI